MRKKTFEVTWRGDVDITEEDVLLALQEAFEDLASEFKVTEQYNQKKNKEKREENETRLDEEQIKRMLSQLGSVPFGGVVQSKPEPAKERSKWEKWAKSIGIPTIMLLVTLIAVPSYGAEISVETSKDRDVTVGLQNDAQVSNLHLFLDPLPSGITVLQPGFEASINTANSHMLYYTYNKNTTVPSGDIMTLHYPNVVENTTITVNAIGASDVSATTLVSVQGGVGSIKLTFFRQDIDDTIAVVIGESSTGGVDWDEDGDIDELDIQGLINNAEE